MRLPTFLLITVGMLSPAVGQGASCISGAASIQQSHQPMRTAMATPSLDEARAAASQAKAQFRSASASLDHCPCPTAADAFERASRHARLAEFAPDRESFNHSYARLLKSYRIAIDEVRTCMEARSPSRSIRVESSAQIPG